MVTTRRAILRHMIERTAASGKRTRITSTSKADVGVISRPTSGSLGTAAPAGRVQLGVDSFHEILRRGKSELGRKSNLGVDLFTFHRLVLRLEGTEILKDKSNVVNSRTIGDGSSGRSVMVLRPVSGRVTLTRHACFIPSIFMVLLSTQTGASAISPRVRLGTASLAIITMVVLVKMITALDASILMTGTTTPRSTLPPSFTFNYEQNCGSM